VFCQMIAVGLCQDKIILPLHYNTNILSSRFPTPLHNCSNLSSRYPRPLHDHNNLRILSYVCQGHLWRKSPM
jgi:hypothetical protein